MSSSQTTCHDICTANGVRSPHLESHEVLEKEFESNPQVKPMHKAIRQYMHMVGVMCLYVRDARTALEEFVKYFFRTGQAQFCQDDSHISSRDVTA